MRQYESPFDQGYEFDDVSITMEGGRVARLDIVYDQEDGTGTNYIRSKIDLDSVELVCWMGNPSDPEKHVQDAFNNRSQDYGGTIVDLAGGLGTLYVIIVDPDYKIGAKFQHA